MSAQPTAAARIAAAFLATVAIDPALARASACDPTEPCPDTPWPTLVGAQYTFVRQHQSRLDSPYEGRLSLDPEGDTEQTHTIGFYFGWAPTSWAQAYVDVEKFMGAGVSGSVGLAGLTNGDVVREGAAGLPKVFYIARQYVRLMLPLAPGATHVDAAQDQLGGNEADTRLEFKFGLMSASDDFDRNRYASSTRTQFMNWSLWDNSAWDYAANTRGYTYGAVFGFVSPHWSLKYGAYLMPVKANGQELENSPGRARGENMELTLSPPGVNTVLRLLAYRNTARMGIYRDAVQKAAAAGTVPDIVADDAEGRHKYGFGINVEQPLADDGETGAFARLGWNDGKTESFAFTEVDRLVSVGGQVSGHHWMRPADRLGAAVAVEGLSDSHRDYLAAGGAGFLLGDGRLNYGSEQILEVYYSAQLFGTRLWQTWPLKIQLTPDFQYIRNPAYNRDRGPVKFWAVRFHVEL